MYTFFTAKFGEKNFPRGASPWLGCLCCFRTKKGFEKVHAWRNQNQSIVNMGGRPTGPTYLHDYLKHTKDIWHDFSKNIKVQNFMQKIQKKVFVQNLKTFYLSYFFMGLKHDLEDFLRYWFSKKNYRPTEISIFFFWKKKKHFCRLKISKYFKKYFFSNFHNFLSIWYFFIGPKYKVKDFFLSLIFWKKIDQTFMLKKKFFEFFSKDLLLKKIQKKYFLVQISILCHGFLISQKL